MGLVWFHSLNGIVGYFMPKQKNRGDIISSVTKGSYLSVDVTGVQTCFKATVQHFCHNATGIPNCLMKMKFEKVNVSLQVY